ncbi:MAG: glycosyl hydrolase family 25 [Alloprevotella sp.]|nr:glycosyl hydrolase family 25 [Alloprevotella sp.]
MKLSPITFTAIILALLTVLPSYGRKDPKKKHESYAAGTLPPEPDAPQQKATAERIVAPQQDMHKPQVQQQQTPKGRINANYRQGIDVSHYQYSIDWAALARNENISYAYIKATEGNNLRDDYYRRNLEGARRAGISVGSYHFYRPNVDWRQQLELMKAVIKPEEQDLVPLIDIEKFSGSEAAFVSNLRQFVEAVTRYYGKKPLLYTYQNFYNKHFLNMFRDYHWMIACYSPAEPVLKDGRTYIMWQYSCSGRLSGIRGDVDRSCLMPGFDLRQLQM